MRQESPHDVGISAVVAHELFYGAFKSVHVVQNVALIDGLRFPVVAFDGVDARQAGEVRARLAVMGTPIGPYDSLIAGQALARQAILITRNLREFALVPALQVENWED